MTNREIKKFVILAEEIVIGDYQNCADLPRFSDGQKSGDNRIVSCIFTAVDVATLGGSKFIRVTGKAVWEGGKWILKAGIIADVFDVADTVNDVSKVDKVKDLKQNG